MKTKTLIASSLLAVSSIAYADPYGWSTSSNPNDNMMENYRIQNQQRQLQMDQQRQFEQQQQQMERMRQENYQMQQELQRQRMIRNGQGRPNSLADEVYR